VILLLLAFGCLVGAVFLVGDVATAPARQRRASVARAASYSRVLLRTGDARSFGERVLHPLSDRLAGAVLRFSPKTTLDAVNRKLLTAGLSASPNTFLAIKGGGAVAGLVVGIALGAGIGGGSGAIFGAMMLGVLGWIGPEYVLTLKGRARRDQIRAALPDALDLLAVSVEAGLGFDAAITKITEHLDGPLSDEFGLTLGEMRVGESRSDALRKMEQRVGAPELASFVRAIIQADQLGISLGRILRVQATDSRNKRQSAAEEKAMKAPIKMLFPTVLFIFPAMFIVVLGPAMLSILSLFNG
jgi:tight adherence protein C